eukprot:1047599_1
MFRCVLSNTLPKLPAISSINGTDLYQYATRLQSEHAINAINRNLMELCNNRKLSVAIKEMDAILEHNATKLNSNTLNLLLTGCQNERCSISALKVWSKLVVTHHVIPNLISYRIAITLIGKDANLKHQTYVYQLIKDLKTVSSTSSTPLTHNEWWTIINCYRLYGDGANMLKEYNHLLSSHSGPKLNSKYILSSLFEGLINSGQPYHVESIWNDIIHKYAYTHHQLKRLFDSKALQSLVFCVGQSGNKVSDHFLCGVWRLLVHELEIKPEISCYCLATFVLSKSKDDSSLQLCHKLLMDLNGNKERLELLKLNKNAIFFRQILRSYGNLNQFDAMWSFYNRIKRNNHDDIIAVNVLASTESRLNIVQTRVLDHIIRKYVDLNGVSVHDLIGFYRLADRCKDQSMKGEIWDVLSNKPENIKTNVICTFDMNGREYIIENGYKKGCEFKSVTLVEKLIKEMDYTMDTLCALELPDEKSRERHLKSHSEKKALAIALQHGANHEEIKINVSMRMCVDCHKFFACVSKHYNRQIHCRDPRG